MQMDSFAKDVPGQLVLVGRGEAAYHAFIPNPLPPKLELTPALVSDLDKATYALGELAGLGRLLPNPNLLVLPFIRKEAVLSSRIEGTRADITNLYAYEAGQLHLPGFAPQVREEEILEVLNYVKAMQHGVERLATLPVSLRFVRELHTILMEGVRGKHATPGEFRKSQNWIGPPNCSLREAEYVPPPPENLLDVLSDWEMYIHADDSFPPLIKLALIHYQFEAIHPFLDGNGRIGRLLNSLLLIDWGLLPLPLLYLSVYFERNRSLYYDHLMQVSTNNAWEGWVRFFLQGVVSQCQDAIGRAKALQDLQIEWRTQLTGESRVSGTLIGLAESLFENPIITIPQAQTLLSVTYKTASRNVSKLVDAGLLSQFGDDSYNRVFFAPEILSIIQDN